MTQETTATPRCDAAQTEYENAFALHGFDLKTVWLRFRTLEIERNALERSIRSAIASIEAGNHHLALTTLEAAIQPRR